jgi:hypothetical protein
MFQNKSYEAINIENAGIMVKSTKSTKSTVTNKEGTGIVVKILEK